MKTALKIVCAAAISFALLACDTGTNAINEVDPTAKGNTNKPGESDYLPSYNPSGVIINDEMKVWIEEQLASEGKEKKLIVISDMQERQTQMEPLVSSGRYNSTTRETEYYVNGQKMTTDEYDDFMKEWWKEYYEDMERNKRILLIPGELVESGYRMWTAWMTAENIVELVETYKEIAISFYSEPVAE
jgi:hypothetical protein